MPQFIKVAERSEIAEGTGKCIEVEGKQIALFHLGDEFYAIDDTCTHRGGPLSEGSIEGDEVECPWHRAHFNIKSGQVTGPPAGADVTAYTVRVTGENIEVEV